MSLRRGWVLYLAVIVLALIVGGSIVYAEQGGPHSSSNWPFFVSRSGSVSGESRGYVHFPKGSVLFFSSNYLRNVSRMDVRLNSARAVFSGGCSIERGPTYGVDFLKSGPGSVYVPFGYDGIKWTGWNPAHVKGFVVSPASQQFKFLVVEFSDPQNCNFEVKAIDVTGRVGRSEFSERLSYGYVRYLRTK